MENFDIIKEFFTNMRCSQCHSYFKEDSVKVLRQENNYTVVRVICSKCDKNIGLAIMGLDKDSMKSTSELAENYENSPFEYNSTNEPISYDDVIDAHNFIYSLEGDWTKYLPKLSDTN